MSKKKSKEGRKRKAEEITNKIAKDVHVAKAITIKIMTSRLSEDILKQAIREKRWFEGVAFSTIALEGACYYRLRNYLTSEGVRGTPFLRGVSLYRLAKIMKELYIIDNKTHSWIREVNKYRNEVIHELGSPDYIEPKKAKETIEKTLRCLEVIVSSYESMKEKK